MFPVPQKTILQAEFVELITIWPKQANLNLFEKSMLDAPVEMSVTSGSKYPTLAWPPADVPDSVIRENLGEFDCVTKLFDPDVLE